MNRCQFLLQQGLFVADVCYYYGDQVPNFARLKSSDPAGVLPGYDYDVINEEVLVNKMTFRDGRLMLPDGMSYRVLVLPEHGIISLAALKKVAKLVDAGATVIGPKPWALTGLTDYPNCDKDFAALADAVWNACDGHMRQRKLFWQREGGVGPDKGHSVIAPHSAGFLVCQPPCNGITRFHPPHGGRNRDLLYPKFLG